MKFLPIIIMSRCGIPHAAISMGVRIFSNSSTPVNICIGGGGGRSEIIPESFELYDPLPDHGNLTGQNTETRPG